MAAAGDVNNGHYSANSVPEPQATSAYVAASDGREAKGGEKWPGWPGYNAFRVVVPVEKVGALIGKKGELIKKLCEESRAKVRVLDGALGTPDRIVLISGKEEPEADISPAVVAALRVCKRVNGISDTGIDAPSQPPSAFKVQLLVTSTQGLCLIGKHGSTIKSIQESSGASIRVIKEGEVPYYASVDEQVVCIQGEPLHGIKALEAVLQILRKFLIDQSILPLFERRNVSIPAQAQDPWSDKAQSLTYSQPQTFEGNDLPLRDRDPFFLERDSQLDSKIRLPTLSSLYGEPPLSSLYSPRPGRSVGAIVSQVTQTMQIPLKYADDVIGPRGNNISYIRDASGALLTIQGGGSLSDIAIEIKGTSKQVKYAEQLIQDSISPHSEPAPNRYGSFDAADPYASLPRQRYGGFERASYEASYGGYGSFRP